MKTKAYIVLIVIVLLITLGIYLSYGNRVETLPENRGEINGSVIEPLAFQEGLPDAVERTRQAIYEAAASRSYAALGALATYPNFSYSFGAPEESFAEYLELSAKTEGESAFDIIPTILRLPYSKSGAIYTWPGIFHKELETWTASEVAMLKTFLSQEQINNYVEFGGYIYYRIGIDENGEWVYYIAGD